MKLPPGPQTPALIQKLQWITRPLELMDNCAHHYGDLFTVKIGPNSSPIVFASNPQAIQEILTGNANQFDASGKTNEIFRPLLGDNSVILLSGTQHLRQRQLLMPPFHGERMRAYGQLISNITEQVMSQWVIDQPFSIRMVMQEISLRVILHAVFGLDEGPRYHKLRQLLSSGQVMTRFPLSASLLFFKSLQRDLGPWSPWGQFVRRQQQIDELLYEEIQERREQSDTSRTDILSLLLTARDEAGQPMTDAELRDELITLLTAGQDTTATALAWALYWIHHLPHVRAALLQELDSLNESSDPSTIARLPYLGAVCSETLRIYPVGMITFPRIVKSRLQLLNYQLEPGTVLVGCIYLTHHRQDLYPAPEHFQPERFLERQFSPYEYLPFGGGSRRCIGMAFAQFEMKLVLAKILSHFQLALANSYRVQPVRRGVTLAPSSGLQIVATGLRQRAKVQVSL